MRQRRRAGPVMLKAGGSLQRRTERGGGGTVVLPKPGIGTGLSQLQGRAQQIMEHIRQLVRDLMLLARVRG